MVEYLTMIGFDSSTIHARIFLGTSMSLSLLEKIRLRVRQSGVTSWFYWTKCENMQMKYLPKTPSILSPMNIHLAFPKAIV